MNNVVRAAGRRTAHLGSRHWRKKEIQFHHFRKMKMSASSSKVVHLRSLSSSPFCPCTFLCHCARIGIALETQLSPPPGQGDPRRPPGPGRSDGSAPRGGAFVSCFWRGQRAAGRLFRLFHIFQMQHNACHVLSCPVVRRCDPVLPHGAPPTGLNATMKPIYPNEVS